MAGGGNTFAATADTTTDEPTLTLRSLMRDLRRSLRIVLVLVLAGLVGGIVYAVVEPAMPTASSYVLLPASGTNADGQPIQDPQTYAAIIVSPSVLSPAAKAAGVTLPFQALQHRVTVTPVTADDLQITVKAASGRQAINFANDVALAFISYANNSAVVAGEQVQQLGSQQASIQKIISQLEAARTQAENSLATEQSGTTLYTSTENDILQLDDNISQAKIQNQLISEYIDTTKDSASGLSSGVVLLDRAQWATLPSITRWLELAGIGLLGGLLIGIVVALVRGRTDSRLTRRDDIAAAAGVPVISSMSLGRRWRSPDFGYLLDGWSPSVAESARYARLLHGVSTNATSGEHADGKGISTVNGTNGHGRDSTLAIVEKGLEVTFALYSGDIFAQAVVVRLAAYAASIGLPVTVVLPEEALLSQLSAALERRSDESDRRRRNLEVVSAGRVGRWDGRSLRIHVLVLDKSDPAFSENAYRAIGAPGSALLVVSAGFATREQVADAREGTSYEHLQLTGVVVANPEPSDPTTGRAVTTGTPLHQRLSSSAVTTSWQP